MNYLQRKMIGAFASLAFVLVYLPLHGFAFGIDAALCASYTVAVFGKAMRKRGMGLFSGEDSKPFLELLVGHLVFLAFLVGIVRFGIYAAATLPDWLTSPIGGSPGGRPLPSGLRLLQALMLFLLGFVESWWLTTSHSQPEASGSKVVWSKSAWERENSNRLRLK